MDYQEIKNLINSTLQGKEAGHQITPLEHQNMIMAVLDYAHEVEITGQSILAGFADSDTYPSMPDDAKLCYVALCKTNFTTTFNNFLDADGHAIQVTCGANAVKFAVLLWNKAYWEKIEQSLTVTT